VAETLPGFRSIGWFALMAPPATSKPIARKVSDDLRTVLAKPGLQQRYREFGTFARRRRLPTSSVSPARSSRSGNPVIARMGMSQKRD
jgi:hypothetical protein